MGKNPPAVQELQETWVQSLVRKIPWRRAWQTTPVLLPVESHGQRSLVACSPYGRRELDATEATEHSCTVVLKFTFNFFLLLHMVIFTAFK